VPLDTRHLIRNRLISATREDPAHVAFDVLRTKLVATLRARGWHRVAITSATPDCGKSFVAANLAISLSRQSGLRTVLMDMDLRRPSLATMLGISAPVKEVVFYCEKCRTVMRRTRDSEILRQYRWHTS